MIRDVVLIGKLNLWFTPGTVYNYSREGFEYLKMVVERITGKKVEQVLQKEKNILWEN